MTQPPERPRAAIVEAMARVEWDGFYGEGSWDGKNNSDYEPSETERRSRRASASAALTALLAKLGEMGFKITGPGVTPKMREAVREFGGSQAVAFLNAAWSDAHAAAPSFPGDEGC